MVSPRKIACVGSGTIGSSWALLFASRGHEVIIHDVKREAMERSMENIRGMLDTLVEYAIVRKSRVKPILSRISTAQELRSVADCDYVQESTIERIESKKAVLRDLEKVVAGDVVIASSTSSLSMTRMQRGMKHPDRTVIAHPFNPPHLMPLVELVGGRETSEETILSVEELMMSLDRVPVRINKELPGFAANRLQTALLREALALLGEGVVDAEGLERIMNAGIGLRWAFMGPVMTGVLAGGPDGMKQYLGHFGPMFTSVCETLSSWTTVPDDVREKSIRESRELSMVRNKSYAQLVRWRDRNLIGILKQRGYL